MTPVVFSRPANHANEISQRSRFQNFNRWTGNAGLAQALIDTSCLDRLPHVYFIGNYSGRINFYAQQTRALNLVWALITKEFIKPGDRVAIVGGGLAGVTAGVALLQMDIQVELYEQHSNLFRYQRNTVTRHVHPSVNFWPEMSLFPGTNFPFLNWCEGTPSQVISVIESELNAYFADAGLNIWSRVIDLTMSATGIAVRLERWTPTEQKAVTEGPYNTVIVACGFGVEQRPPNLPAGLPHSYWHNDDVLPPAAPTWTPDHVFISGTGDGGLIDAIRASLVRFDNGREIIALAKLLDTAFMRQKIKIEIAKEDQAGESYWTSEEAFDAYVALPVTRSFKDRLENNLTRGFTITLNARQPGIFARTSSAIHRVIVANLIKLGRVEKIVGELLSVDWTQQPAQLKVGSKRKDGDPLVSWRGPATRVIVRHGAEGSLEWLRLSKDEIIKLKNFQRMNFANSLERAWPPTFYDNPKKFPPLCSRDYLIHYKPQAHRFFADLGGSVGIGITRQRLHYKVMCDSDAAIGELPKTLFDIPIVGHRHHGELYASRTRSSKEKADDKHWLRPGAALRIGSAPYGHLTLTCFANTESGIGIVLPLHSMPRVNGRAFTILADATGSSFSAELVRSAAVNKIGDQVAGDADVGLFRILD
jgi:hypothetical protein